MIETQSIADFLKELKFFEGLQEEYFKSLEVCAEEISFAKGRLIANEGDHVDKIYFIQHGAVNIEYHSRGHFEILETLHEHDVFGWGWLTQPQIWHFDVRARNAVRTIALDVKAMTQKCDLDHSFGYEMMKRFIPVIAHRLDMARLQLMDVYSPRRRK